MNYKRNFVDPEHAVEQADHILVVHDARICTDYILHRVLHMLHRYRQIPSSLVLNKIDQVKQRLTSKSCMHFSFTFILCI